MRNYRPLRPSSLTRMIPPSRTAPPSRPNRRRPSAAPLVLGVLGVGGLLILAGAAESKAEGPLRVTGSTTVNVVVAEAAEVLRERHGIAILVDTTGGSTGGVTSAADGRADLGMSSRSIDDRDRARHPEADLREIAIGADAVAMVVSRDVWEGGVRALTADQLRAIYEGRVRNWSRLGGPDLRLVFFNKEPGRGTWEVFADFLYDQADKAPAIAHPEVGANEEVRSKVGGTRGALSFVSAPWADGERVFALSLRREDGSVVAPTAAAVADHRYPLGRPLFLITNGDPSPQARLMIDFLLGQEGRAIVRRHGFVPAATATSSATADKADNASVTAGRR